MNVSNSKIELVWRTRQGGGGKTYRKYLDFVIDGQSLRDILQPGDLIGCLGWLSSQAEEQLIRQLMLRQPSQLENQSYELYICPECGDLECGAITVQIEKTANNFIWKDFQYYNGYNDPDFLQDIGPFQFNKTEYWQMLNERLSQIIHSPG